MKGRTLCRGVAMVLAVALSAGARAEDAPARVRPRTYGTSQDSIYHVPITEFVPLDSNWGTRDWFFPGALARFSPGCTGPCLIAVPRLPNGALLTGIEAYFCNTEPNHNYLLGIELNSSWYDGTNTQYLGVSVFSSSSSGCGEFQIADLTPLNYQVNWYNNQLYLIGRIDKQDGTQAFAGVNLYYRLQVSPAPPTPDFNDVPASSPQFQFIEALYASGITAGCGSGNFCPNAPLTRGQMAVFLAKALGLQWP
jgi:S-layer family protein